MLLEVRRPAGRPAVAVHPGALAQGRNEVSLFVCLHLRPCVDSAPQFAIGLEPNADALMVDTVKSCERVHHELTVSGGSWPSTG